MSKSETGQKSIPITMPKIAITTALIMILEEMFTIGIPEMQVDTH
jgi:hypothetical protein